MHLMLTTLPPHPGPCLVSSQAGFGMQCYSTVLSTTPVGLSVYTEAGCRLTLFAPVPACLFPLDYIDNLYIHMAPHLTT